ncbi:MAG: hypothetical protein PHU46_13485 [Rhodocyclaceae bacterium]|nr:hypothetical protein [Rhodocyclaceae bacterium]
MNAGSWLKCLFFLYCLAVTFGSHAAMATYKAEQYFEGLDLAAVKALEGADDTGLQKALAAGADINRPGKQAVVPFLYFIVTNNSSAMVRLFKLGARFDYQLPRALGPRFPESFAWVPTNPDTSMLSVLLEAGLDANYRPDGTSTLIFWTLNPFNKAAFELLLRHGAKINAQDHLGNTVLHESLFLENYALAAYLVDHGADPMLRTTRGRSALDLLNRQKERAVKGSPFEREIVQLLDYLAKKGYR